MVNYDIHIHTHLSACASKEAFMSGYINAARQNGLDTLGFADHAWDESIGGASDWYKPQGYKRLQARKEELKSLDTDGLNILLGAEGEFANMLLGLGDEGKAFVDYVLIPHSHTHMRGFVLPTECIGNPEKHAKYLLNSFLALCGHEKRNLFFGIVHPMYPIGEGEEYVEQVYSHISDDNLFEIANAAKEAGIALEANLSVLKEIPPENAGKHCYNRFFEACRRADCEFFIGSDAHSVDVFNKNHSLKDGLLKSVCMENADFTTAKRRILNV